MNKPNRAYWQRYRNARRNQGSLTRFQPDVLSGIEVRAGVTSVLAPGKRQLGVKPAYPHRSNRRLGHSVDARANMLGMVVGFFTSIHCTECIPTRRALASPMDAGVAFASHAPALLAALPA